MHQGGSTAAARGTCKLLEDKRVVERGSHHPALLPPEVALPCRMHASLHHYQLHNPCLPLRTGSSQTQTKPGPSWEAAVLGIALGCTPSHYCRRR